MKRGLAIAIVLWLGYWIDAFWSNFHPRLSSHLQETSVFDCLSSGHSC